MAEYTGPIRGEAIKGNEWIYQRKIWEPGQPDTRGNTISFKQLIKVVSDDGKNAIMLDGGFRGNKKKFGTNEDGSDLSAFFSWWSVDIPGDEKERLNEEKMDGEELACIYKHGSRYGTNVFCKDLDEILCAYEKCSHHPAEIRVLATYKYEREVMHAFVVTPEGVPTFQQHAIVAKRQTTSNDYVWNMLKVEVEGEPRAEYIVERNEMYEWKPFSIVQWKDLEAPPKQRYWAHLSFAFYLDPLPNNILTVDGTTVPENWEKLKLLSPTLVTALEDEYKDEDDVA